MTVGETERVAALITGGGRGIGRATALELARRGHLVFINYVEDEAAAGEVLTEIVAHGGEGRLLRGNVADDADLERMFKQIEESGVPLAVLVNNAGVTEDALFLDIDADMLERLWKTNFLGAVACTRLALPDMVSRRYGRIVNVSSVLVAQPNRGVAAYAATKGALEAMTRALAVEVGARNITVNAVAPGFIMTRMTAGYSSSAEKAAFVHNAARRAGSCEEVAAAIAFLASPAASFISGQVLTVNGGPAPLTIVERRP